MDKIKLTINNLIFVLNDDDIHMVIKKGNRYSNLSPGDILDLDLEIKCNDCDEPPSYQYLGEIELVDVSIIEFEKISCKFIPKSVRFCDYELDMSRNSKFFNKNELVTLIFFKL
jgi:hypothetical protein